MMEWLVPGEYGRVVSGPPMEPGRYATTARGGRHRGALSGQRELLVDRVVAAATQASALCTTATGLLALGTDRRRGPSHPGGSTRRSPVGHLRRSR